MRTPTENQRDITRQEFDPVNPEQFILGQNELRDPFVSVVMTNGDGLIATYDKSKNKRLFLPAGRIRVFGRGAEAEDPARTASFAVYGKPTNSQAKLLGSEAAITPPIDDDIRGCVYLPIWMQPDQEVGLPDTINHQDVVWRDYVTCLDILADEDSLNGIHGARRREVARFSLDAFMNA